MGYRSGNCSAQGSQACGRCGWRVFISGETRAKRGCSLFFSARGSRLPKEGPFGASSYKLGIWAPQRHSRPNLGRGPAHFLTCSSTANAHAPDIFCATRSGGRLSALRHRKSVNSSVLRASCTTAQFTLSTRPSRSHGRSQCNLGQSKSLAKKQRHPGEPSPDGAHKHLWLSR